uniref:Lipoxygenase domain-containing protein n=1 Tax=Latimeria chalumnae TaxID=7897 RepID=H2ZV54_LATCH
EVAIKENLGKIITAKLHKRKPWWLPGLVPDLGWFCRTVTVTAPDGAVYNFLCFRWVKRGQTIEIREGKATKPLDDKLQYLKTLRHNELMQKQFLYYYRFKEYSKGMPHATSKICINPTARFTQISHNGVVFLYPITVIKITNFTSTFLHTCKPSTVGFFLFGFFFVKMINFSSEYIINNWNKDTFFGSQILNGINPIMIELCQEIPENMAVDKEMKLEGGRTLQEEVENKKIYKVDYKALDKVKPNEKGKHFIAAPICLLHQQLDDSLVPIAIQLFQSKSELNPVFTKQGSDSTWTLVKIWVRNSDFYVQEVSTHLQRTHLLAEVFWVAAYRQLADIHPVYKLLIPHGRYTLQINVAARKTLINENGIFDDFTGLGLKGHEELASRAFKETTYESLCLPADMQKRGVGDLKNYYYRDDAMKLWLAIQDFVKAFVNIFYESEDDVVNDSEVQAWVHEVFTEGFLENEESGVPSTLKTKDDLVEYLTMVIFTCSAQHAAVNNGQRLLGQYSENHFAETEMTRAIEGFKKRLKQIEVEIKARNKNLPFPYKYLLPSEIENSVAI